MSYISSFTVRINDQIGMGTPWPLRSDIISMITDKGIKSGCFGFDNKNYNDTPPSVGKWGAVEFFKHADNFVTVKLYPESVESGFYISQFVIGESDWKIPWKRVQYA